MRAAAIDFETATDKRSSACAVGVAIVDDSKVVEVRSWLIRPPALEFHGINMLIHGIGPDDVVDAPEFESVWRDVLPLVEGRTLVAHSAGFDMSVLRHSLDMVGEPYPEAEYICSRVLAKRAWPGLSRYDLASIAEQCGITFNHHDAAEDARACAEVAIHACHALGGTTLGDAMGAASLVCGRLYPGGYISWDSGGHGHRARSIQPTVDSFDPEHPFYGRTVVFTGTLDRMVRAEAMQRVVNCGGVCADSVSKKVQYLVIGDQDYIKLRGGTKSSKMKRAEDLAAAGHDIETISESEFYRLVATT